MKFVVVDSPKLLKIDNVINEKALFNNIEATLIENPSELGIIRNE